MLTKIRSLYANLVHRLLSRTNRKEKLLRQLRQISCGEIEQTKKNRLYQVRRFLHEDLPTLYPEKFAGRLIIEGGTYNYFAYPDGSLPLIDFVIPEIPLFICLGGPSSTSWELAETLGIDQQDWIVEQAKISIIKERLPDIAVELTPTRIYSLYLNWNDPVDTYSLLARIKEVMVNVLNN